MRLGPAAKKPKPEPIAIEDPVRDLMWMCIPSLKDQTEPFGETDYPQFPDEDMSIFTPVETHIEPVAVGRIVFGFGTCGTCAPLLRFAF